LLIAAKRAVEIAIEESEAAALAYAKRYFVERLFCRLKDWRRVATRYDRKVSTYLATVTIAAIVMFWL